MLRVRRGFYVQSRNFWEWLNLIFNKVDVDRRKQFGPDRTCAEWLLRNGAAVKWTVSQYYLRNYNLLPKEGVTFHIQEVDATDSSIADVGFTHFKGCQYVEKIILHKCSYIEDGALKELVAVKDSLKHLQVSNCPNITRTGLLYIPQLIHLQKLVLYDLPYVNKMNEISDVLQQKLPKCQFTYSRVK